MKKKRNGRRSVVPGGDEAVRPAPMAKVRYEDAMAQREAGTLMRAVLTDEGWVMPSERGHIGRSE